ncbi:hypothetical protein G6F35_015770 [Rhizopus arrhizus]|nr:hypothetical protein G6F35_015770 [Rhizopus arrhizus]
MAAAACVSLTAGAALAQQADWPAHAITLGVPFAAGGGGDTLARLVAEPLSRELGQSIIVENRPGAGGNIGASIAARAKPDGYTLVASSQSSHLANPLMRSDLGYDPIKDFTSISQLSRTPNVLVTNIDVPAKTLAEFVALLKARPDESRPCTCPTAAARP